MIINKLDYRIYGKLIDQEILLNKGINVIYGENEAGKSTIFNSVASLIYGFKPTNREKHPYVNWDKNEINFSSEIENSGELFIAERSLKSVPKLNLIHLKSNTAKIYRNETLPFVTGVSDALFEAVFHLSAEDLNQVEKESWESIQEKLIFNYGTEYLNRASDVILKLEQEINGLWRRDKKGNPQINQLQIEINTLKLKRNEAEKYYELTKSKMARLEEITEELIQATHEKKTLDLELKKLRVSLPIKNRLEKISELKRTLYKTEEFSKLDSKIIEKIETGQQRIKELKDKLEEKTNEKLKLSSELFVFTDHDLNLSAFKKESETLKATLSDLMRLEQEEHTKLEELIKFREKVSGQFKILFDGEIDETIKAALKNLKVLDIMSFLQKYTEGYEKNEAFRQREEISQANTRKSHLLLGLLGLVAIAIGLFVEPIRWIAFVGVGFAGYSFAKIKPQNRDTSPEIVDLETLKLKIETLVQGLVLPDYVWRDTSLRFFSKLEQLIMNLYEEDQLHENWLSLIEKQKQLEMNIDQVMRKNGFDTTRGSKLSLQFILAQIERIIEIEGIESRKTNKIELIESSIQNLLDEIQNYSTPLQILIKEIENFGAGDYLYGLEKFSENVDLLKKIRLYSDELESQYFDETEVIQASPERIEEIEGKLYEINELEKSCLTEKHTVTTEIERFNEMLDTEEINSRILADEELLSELVARRNKLMILLEVIKFSDERYRIQNQPNIITRVSRFMKQMTKDRYQEVLISEAGGQFELQFMVGGEIIPVSRAFSKGTIQQLFFAYRLAVIEALDPDNALPFVLDEAFVNWDVNRLVETIKLLEEVSKKRQILIFTCHRTLAQKIAEVTSINLVEVNV